MLEGLEIKEVTIKTCYTNKDFRIDSSFHTNEPFINSSLKYMKIGECLMMSQYGLSINMNENGLGYPIFRMNEIHNQLCDIDVNKYAQITEVETEAFKLHDKDVLFNRTNSFDWVGRTGIYYKNDDADRVFASYLVRFVPNTIYILPEYLTAYLNSKYGVSDIRRRARQSVNQTNVNPEEVKEMLIPILHMSIQKCIADKLQLANKKRITAHNLYLEAEKYLLSLLKINDFQTTTNTCNVKSLKESFLATGRFDAEYYQPKYDEILNQIQSYGNGSSLLGGVCEIDDANYTPQADIDYKYVELADIGKHGEITRCSQLQGKDLPTRARRIVRKGDVVVSSVEGSLDSCAFVDEEFDGALCSTGFYILRSKVLNPETLLVLFKTPVIKELMKKGCSGAILAAINRQELERIPLPIVRMEVQDEIAQYVQRSFSLRKEALNLLESARLTVEDVIQNGGGKIALTYNSWIKESVEHLRCAIWILLQETGVLNSVTMHKKISVYSSKKLSDSFIASGRLDAEYYQPKYDRLLCKLKSFPTATIKNLVAIQKSIEPGSDAYQEKGIPFIRVSNLSKFGISDSEIKLDAATYANAIRPRKDTILLSKDGSVGIAYKMEEPANIITSGAILHLSVIDNKVLPDYLTLVLNSIVVKLQAERDAGGSIIQHWKPSEIENVVIPILTMNEQQRIADKVQQSFRFRKESQLLLEEAKNIVEQAINS